MLDAGGGGGYAGTTDWYAHNVESMWRLLENQETDNHWKHASAWKKTYELTSTHLWRLKDYRENLAAAWPPEKSAASRAFIERLDYLITHVESVYKVASANYTTFSTATSAIYTSRYDLKKIYDEYVKRKQQKQEYDELVEAEKASLLPGTTLGDPPVTDADLKKLDAQARSIMYSLGSTLVEARLNLQKPEPYKPQGFKDETMIESYGGPGTGPPPAIPPVVPITTSPPPLSHGPTPAPATPPQIVTTPSPPSVGPVLGSAGPVATAPPPIAPTAPSVIAPSPVNAPGPAMPPTMPLNPGTLPGNGKVRGSSPINSPLGTGAMGPGGGPLTKPGTGGVAGGPRAMPPGGLIGGAPGTAFGQPGAPAQPARRVNPVGGVIGAQRSGAPAVGPMQAGAGQPFAPHGAHPGQRRDDDEQRQRWDPDNPWETDEGVAPVVRPSRETGRIDPGPAIGFDR